MPSHPLPHTSPDAPNPANSQRVYNISTSSRNSICKLHHFRSITRPLGRHLETRPLVEDAAAAAAASSIPRHGRRPSRRASSPFLGSGPLAIGRSSVTWLYRCVVTGQLRAGDGEDKALVSAHPDKQRVRARPEFVICREGQQ
jgi:hypothetical protein